MKAKTGDISGEAAKKNRGKGKPFQKGQSGNPHGRAPLPDEVKAARKMAYADLMMTIVDVRSMTQNDLGKLDMSTVPLGKRAIISAYAKSDFRGIREYEDRLFGRPQESVSISGEDGGPVKVDLGAWKAKLEKKLKTPDDNG